jgi:hypothetical protein
MSRFFLDLGKDSAFDQGGIEDHVIPLLLGFLGRGDHFWCQFVAACSDSRSKQREIMRVRLWIKWVRLWIKTIFA